MKKFITSEYVGVGHPDKVADQISDSILDLHLEKDQNSRVAAETLVSGRHVFLTGEISSETSFSDIEIKRRIHETIGEAGYGKNLPCHFRQGNILFNILLKPQSININSGVNRTDGDIGAGDQGIMFGYATKETKKYHSLPYALASTLLNSLNEKILLGQAPNIFTDNKSQVCCSYENGLIRVEKVLLSTFHHPDFPLEDVRSWIWKEIIEPILGDLSSLENGHKFGKSTPEIFINSAGPFFIGGPEADAGLTGRKIIVDTYGGAAPHGGGAFSGKDPSKVDRSAAYMARHIAKNLVANEYCERALVQLSYAIGHTQPFSIWIEGDGDTKELVSLVRKSFDLSPKGIIDYLKLTDPSIIKYSKLASGGHFLDENLPWEKIVKL